MTDVERTSAEDGARIAYDPDYLHEYFEFIGMNPHFVIRSLVRSRRVSLFAHEKSGGEFWNPRYKVIQFWDTATPPDDVNDLINSWKRISPSDCHLLFNMETAREFIRMNYVSEFVEAFDFCYHPAMQSDYFRLAYLYLHGGFYIDADEKPGSKLPSIDLSVGNSVIVTPLIREVDQNKDGSYTWLTITEMCQRPSSLFGPVCYLNNNALFATARNDIIKAALMRATRNIFSMKSSGQRRSIHLMTGPSCLTYAVGAHLMYSACAGSDASNVQVIDRQSHFTNDLSSTMHLAYKSDKRNWIKAEQSGD